MSLAMATCQPTASSDPRANGAEVRRMMRVSAAAGVRLVHFPEGFLSGYAVANVAAREDVDWAVVRPRARRCGRARGRARDLSGARVCPPAHPATLAAQQPL